MKEQLSKLDDLKKLQHCNYWSDRIISQLLYAYEISKINGNAYDDVINEAIEYLYKMYENDQCITKETAVQAEKIILSLSEKAKSYKMICAAHAHIDMNWMWGFAETVAITLDTFRTMLNLMNEYPQFTFSQSQASVYKIVEEYDPEMLEEIRKRVKEGRWEVTASTWVETDKNMPSGESLSRHILYTKKYLSQLLDISPDTLQIDFEPDTFGHNINVPEILSNAGVKYYYHCRGYDGHLMYKWQSPSSSSIIVYREPFWYNAEIDSSVPLYVPRYCSEHGIDTMLKVYGVGDHGGGPTRRDIERIIDMSSWPVFPVIKFGKFIDFFKVIEGISDKLPVVDKELNFVFTGCYTTQTRIKTANRIGEAKMNEAEAYNTLSALTVSQNYPRESFKTSWEKILFNHFHDIIPGSGVIDTREYAMGEFQKVLAVANTQISKSIRSIASRIDTSMLSDATGVAYEEANLTVSEGAGVGYSIKDFGVPQTERGRGKTRIFHFFNPSPYERKQPVQITLWDWNGDKNKMVIKDSQGNEVKYQILHNDILPFFNESYWGHSYMKILVDVTVPALGYSTYALSENDNFKNELCLPKEPRVEYEDKYILENELVKVSFDTKTLAVVSFIDKSTGEDIVSCNRPSGLFRVIKEDDNKGMTAWTIGRYMNETILNNEAKNVKYHIDKHSLRQWISWDVCFNDSKLKVTISLDYNSRFLNYDVECDWQEKGKPGKGIPQLNFHMPFAYNCSKYKYDIPFGTIIREPVDMDVPANSWALALRQNESDSALMIISSNKYGFRGINNSLSLTLIRSSFDPDPYPENYIHNFKFAVGITEQKCNRNLINIAYDYNHNISFVSAYINNKNGIMPCVKSFLEVKEGSVIVSAVKMPEENKPSGREIIIRVYETEGKDTRALIKFHEKVADAYYVDINENKINCDHIIKADNDEVLFEVKAWRVASLRIKF